MGHGIRVLVDGQPRNVDGRDVKLAEGVPGQVDPADPLWSQAAERYVEAHPRGGSRLPDAQRLAITRVLAAGPCRTRDLLAAMRSVGWVGADDLSNRLRELRGVGQRGGGNDGLPIQVDGDRVWLTEPFARLDDMQRAALGHVKSLAAQHPQPLTGHALQALDGMLPGVGSRSGQRDTPTMAMSAGQMQVFEHARTTRTPVEVAYFSFNSGRERIYRLVPIEYVPTGPAMKVICKEVQGDGSVGDERQFALDRIRSVRTTAADPVDPAALGLRRETLHLVVTGDLYRIMHDRNQFGIRAFDAEEVDEDGNHDVRGTFPVVLGWDVMEQMCAWAGSVVVYEPLWLVNAVVDRLGAGLTAMQESVLRLVKPQPGRAFIDLADALFSVPQDGETVRVGPRKLSPPGREGLA